jgi:hypothetical protein
LALKAGEWLRRGLLGIVGTPLWDSAFKQYHLRGCPISPGHFCHLEKILREFVAHYNTERPHRGLSLETPEPQPGAKLTAGKVVRVAKLGGLINEYHRIAA